MGVSRLEFLISLLTNLPSRDKGDKRQRNEDEQAAKRQKLENGEAKEGPFSKDEIAAEERKPKRKVAVLIGYAGSGYKGMQINGNEKTIEGDLFNAFVAAGAISKANADDPKKSSLVRCARTDKGVHAAGNVISLKLIVEDPDVVSKINDALPPQIRVWGFERTNGAFSCYQTCDSRWYEYLIPTYSFLPPHPQSFMGRKLVESARTEDVLEEFEARQEDAKTFWAEAEEKYIKPIMDKLDPQMQTAVMEAIHTSEEEPDVAKNKKKNDEKEEEDGNAEASTEEKPTTVEPSSDKQTTNEIAVESDGNLGAATTEKAKFVNPLDLAIREVKAAYLKAKKAYRISPARRQRVQDALSAYLGTRNFHNYTIQKTFRDPSAKRVIRSFLVGDKPIIINDTEWLSLKVHGQSFMMHQIRKMVAMVALVVRCGTPIERIQESYGPDNISIPKAPGLGLLLERPVFDSYNERAVSDLQREKIDFDKYKDTIEEFKQREIYERIFREEEKEHQ
jgi:tRNA pseudouridine38-40 synthase